MTISPPSAPPAQRQRRLAACGGSGDQDQMRGHGPVSTAVVAPAARRRLLEARMSRASHRHRPDRPTRRGDRRCRRRPPARAIPAVAHEHLAGAGDACEPSRRRRPVVARAARRRPGACHRRRLVPAAGARRKRLLVADMDSTIIKLECLDELADFAGVKARDLRHHRARHARRAGFRGRPARAGRHAEGPATPACSQQAYDQRVTLNPGAGRWSRTMAANGARCALVSGGFTFFTEPRGRGRGLPHAPRQHARSRRTAELTGTVGEPILGREAKLARCRSSAAALRPRRSRRPWPSATAPTTWP